MCYNITDVFTIKCGTAKGWNCKKKLGLLYIDCLNKIIM